MFYYHSYVQPISSFSPSRPSTCPLKLVSDLPQVTRVLIPFSPKAVEQVMNMGFTNVTGREQQQEGNQKHAKDSEVNGQEDSTSGELQSIEDNQEFYFLSIQIFKNKKLCISCFQSRSQTVAQNTYRHTYIPFFRAFLQHTCFTVYEAQRNPQC